MKHLKFDASLPQDSEDAQTHNQFEYTCNTVQQYLITFYQKFPKIFAWCSHESVYSFASVG